MSPATLRTFEESPLPQTVVVDSSFVFEALIDPLEGDGRHEMCARFAQRLRRDGVTLVVSPLILLEAPQCWRRLHSKGALPLPGDSTAGPEQVARAFQAASARLTEFLRAFDRWEISLGEDLFGLAARHAGRYGLRSHDALIVALTSATGVYDVVTLDRDFDRVPTLTVWTEPRSA